MAVMRERLRRATADARPFCRTPPAWRRPSTNSAGSRSPSSGCTVISTWGRPCTRPAGGRSLTSRVSRPSRSPSGWRRTVSGGPCRDAALLGLRGRQRDRTGQPRGRRSAGRRSWRVTPADRSGPTPRYCGPTRPTRQSTRSSTRSGIVRTGSGSLLAAVATLVETESDGTKAEAPRPGGRSSAYTPFASA